MPVLWEGQTEQGSFGNGVKIEPKVLHACKLLSVLGDGVGRSGQWISMTELPSFVEIDRPFLDSWTNRTKGTAIWGRC